MLLLLLACSGAPDPTTASGGPLDGTWRAEEECGTTTGGSPVVVGYTLTVTGTQASLEADGYQTMLRARGQLSAREDGGWDLYFEEAGEGGAFSEMSRPGDLLLGFQLREGVLEGTPRKLTVNCSTLLRFERG